MIQILQGPERKQSIGSRLSEGVERGLEMGSQIMQQKEMQKQQQQQQQMMQQAGQALLGMDISSFDPQTQKALLVEGLKQQGQGKLQAEKFGLQSEANAKKLRGEQEEQIKPLEGALDSLNRMKKLRKKGKLGIGASYSPFSETRKEAGEYEQLGKSLIQYATNIPIRNRIEFETLAEELYNPNITDAKAEGILNAMERIINNSMKAAGGGSEKSTTGSQKKERPPLSNFQR